MWPCGSRSQTKEQERLFPLAEREKQTWLARRKAELADIAPYQREHILRKEAKDLGYTGLVFS